MPRYVFCPFRLAVGDDAREFWFGIESEEELPLSGTKFGELTPADGMTDDELAIVRKWFKA